MQKYQRFDNCFSALLQPVINDENPVFKKAYMFVKLDLYLITCSLGMFVLLFQAFVLLFSKNGNKKANRYLAFFLLTSSYCIFGFGLLEPKGLYLHVPHLIFTVIPVLSLVAPSLYLYISEILDPEDCRNPKKYIHFIPIIIVSLFLMPFFLRSGKYKLETMINWMENGIYMENRTTVQTLYTLIYIQNIAYILSAKKKIRRFFPKSKTEKSSIKRTRISWIDDCLNLYLLALVFIPFLVMLCLLKSSFLRTYNFVPAVIAAFGCVITCKVLTKAVSNKTRREKTKLRTDKICQMKIKSYKEQLLEAMENEKIYRNPDISLGVLSEKLNINKNYLSHVINSHMGTNFYSLINTYRLKEVKKNLKNTDSSKDNLKTIAYYAGFRSKTTFNEIFRKHTGMTPSQYRKKNMEKISVPE